MQTYRRFVSYVYQYENGKKAGNRGFIKVEARGNTCSMQIALKGICKDGNGHCKVYGFKREDGLLKGSLLAECPVKTGIVQEQLVFLRNEMGRAGYSLSELSGVIFQGDDENMYGTQWDDEPMKMENFQPDEANDRRQSREEAPAETEQKAEIVEEAAEEILQKEQPAAETTLQEGAEMAAGQPGSKEVVQLQPQESEAQVKEEQAEADLESIVSAMPRERQEEPKELEAAAAPPNEEEREKTEAKEVTAAEKPLEAMQQEYPVEMEIQKESGISPKVQAPSGAYTKPQKERELPPDPKTAIAPEQEYKEAEMPVKMQQEAQIPQEQRSAQTQIESSTDRQEEQIPASAQAQIKKQMPASAETRIDNQIPMSAGARIDNQIPVPTEARIENQIPVSAEAQAENRVPAFAETQIENQTPSFAESQTESREPSFAEAQIKDQMPIPTEAQTENRMPAFTESQTESRTPSFADSQEESKEADGGKAAANPPEDKEEPLGILDTTIPVSELRRRKNTSNYIKSDIEAANMQEPNEPKRKDFCPFTDGVLQDCRKISLEDLRFLDPRDQGMRSNRFVQHGYQMFGHLLLAKSGRNSQYILGVPGMYQQQEKFMADMFGFHNFKYARRSGSRPACFGYWYRLIYPPKLGGRDGCSN